MSNLYIEPLSYVEHSRHGESFNSSSDLFHFQQSEHPNPVNPASLFPRDASSLGRKREQVTESGPRMLNILVAEDNVTNQLVITKMLERLGHMVTIAENGKEALSKAQSSHYDLIFMDIQMPEMDGVEAVRQMRLQLPADRIPIIVAVTANALMGDREHCLTAGMDDYLTKPLKTSMLSEVIKRYFGEDE
ncbi:multi-sensor hybrid histidine kinase [Paenibacillus algicola]|uniref:Multi-sensor hybrid histidine kinase n=1 Tax=Paenibacillus algicola TaxID=2565926 RepID=A0A4P8XL69_9BACL|nr:response regulator [Paenibacillus algicola]QCT03035.1 multi-sensor hybrid histidine kinase [Paenibacillus algicola]